MSPLGLPELLIVILLLSPFLVVFLYRKLRKNRDEPASNQYKGVNGWLLFFCVSLTILSPLFTLANISKGYSTATKLADRLPSLMTATIIDSAVSFMIMAFSILAGVSLWSVRPNAVKIAKAYLIALLVYSVLEIPLFIVTLPSEASDAFMRQSTVAVVRTLLYVGLWYSYLSKSKRVKATYFDADDNDYIGLNLNR